MQCLSECVFILAAGTSRSVEPGARVGLSPSLITKDLGVFDADRERPHDSAVYFTGMGVDGGKLAVLATSLTSGDIHLLTPGELEEVGLVDAKLPALARDPLATRSPQVSPVEWWWLLTSILGLAVVLRAATTRWTGG
jgi:hypothetical protein